MLFFGPILADIPGLYRFSGPFRRDQASRFPEILRPGFAMSLKGSREFESDCAPAAQWPSRYPTGEACPIVPEEWLVGPGRDSIAKFLNGPVRNFFIGQILVENGHPWPFGERQHGVRRPVPILWRNTGNR